MLSVFKINDPYRLVIVLLFLIVVQLPFYFSDLFITIPEIEWQVLGDKLTQGEILYVDVYHTTGLFSSIVYWILAEFFPDNYLVYRLLALALIFFQALLFNIILLQHKAYNQNTYVPAAIYALLMVGIPDMAVLTPHLMSLTFILLAFDLIFRHLEGRRKQDWIVLQIGIYLAVASLFYPLNYLMLLSTVLAFIFYTNTLLRRYLLLFIGFLLPYLLIWLKYFWFNQESDFYFILKHLFFPSTHLAMINWKTFITLITLPIIYLFLSFIKVINARAFINYQTRLQNYMLIMILVGVVMLVFDNYQATHVLVMLIPAFSFFITHYFLLIRKVWLAELMFLIFTVFLLMQNFIISFKTINSFNWLSLEGQRYNSIELPINLVNKKVLVLGKHSGEYYNNKLATPYLSWEIAQRHINEIDKYNHVIKFYHNFSNDPPEVLIDKEAWAEQIFNKIPQLSMRYKKINDHIYLLM